MTEKVRTGGFILNLASVDPILSPVCEEVLEQGLYVLDWNSARVDPDQLIDIRWLKLLLQCYGEIRSALKGTIGAVSGTVQEGNLEEKRRIETSLRERFPQENFFNETLSTLAKFEQRMSPSLEFYQHKYERSRGSILQELLSTDREYHIPTQIEESFKANSAWHDYSLEENIRKGEYPVFDHRGKRPINVTPSQYARAMERRETIPQFGLYTTRSFCVALLIWYDMLQSDAAKLILVASLPEHHISAALLAAKKEYGVRVSEQASDEAAKKLIDTALHEKGTQSLKMKVLSGLTLLPFLLPQRRYAWQSNNPDDESGANKVPIFIDGIRNRLSFELKSFFQTVEFDRAKGQQSYSVQKDQQSERDIYKLGLLRRPQHDGCFTSDLDKYDGALRGDISRSFPDRNVGSLARLWGISCARQDVCKDEFQYEHSNSKSN